MREVHGVSTSVHMRAFTRMDRQCSNTGHWLHGWNALAFHHLLVWYKALRLRVFSDETAMR